MSTSFYFVAIDLMTCTLISLSFSVSHTHTLTHTHTHTHTHTCTEGAQLSSEDVEPSIVPMLFTNMEGTRSYASGLRFSRPFFVQKVVYGP